MMDSLHSQVELRINDHDPLKVWTATDFADLGKRTSIAKVLERLENEGKLARIDRGFYQRIEINPLTDQPRRPHYSEVLKALQRRDATRMLIDGMTAANDLGLTTAVPAKIIVHTDARRRQINLGEQEIIFKTTAPSRLTWADNPAMRVVQALLWLRDAGQETSTTTARKLADLFSDPEQGEAIRAALLEGFQRLPAEWMRALLRPYVFETNDDSEEDREMGMG